MEIINTRAALFEQAGKLRAKGKKIALVPTMGALHNGHLSLVKLAQQQADITVCSIFVNPTQFTDPKDLEKYPRPLEHDIDQLTKAKCDLVFMPSVMEMYPSYPKPENWHIDLGPAEFVLEGEFRKGHYQGVTQIVKKLFDAAMPHVALFGQKDYQQVLMIKNMAAHFDLPVKIEMCPIIREDDGLAMSSRNVHLSAEDRKNALALSKALFFIANNFHQLSITSLLQQGKDIINAQKGIQLDYLTLANGHSLQPITSKNEQPIVALAAAKVGETRLIDNMLID